MKTYLITALTASMLTSSIAFGADETPTARMARLTNAGRDILQTSDVLLTPIHSHTQIKSGQVVVVEYTLNLNNILPSADARARAIALLQTPLNNLKQERSVLKAKVDAMRVDLIGGRSNPLLKERDLRIAGEMKEVGGQLKAVEYKIRSIEVLQEELSKERMVQLQTIDVANVKSLQLHEAFLVESLPKKLDAVYNSLSPEEAVAEISSFESELGGVISTIRVGSVSQVDALAKAGSNVLVNAIALAAKNKIKTGIGAGGLAATLGAWGYFRFQDDKVRKTEQKLSK